jgi:hypothetical protein
MAEMGGHVASMWQMRNAHKILVGKPEGKKKNYHEGMDWILCLMTGTRGGLL